MATPARSMNSPWGAFSAAREGQRRHLPARTKQPSAPTVSMLEGESSRYNPEWRIPQQCVRLVFIRGVCWATQLRVTRLAPVQRYLGAMVSSRSYSIRQCLMAFGVALVLPGLVFAAILLWRYASAERSRYEEEALGTAQRITAAVDRELVGIQS